MNTIDLHEYARRNDLRELTAAIARGADVNGRDAFDSTPLHCAIAEKNDDAAVLLLRHGADVTAQNRNGSTALHHAAEFGRKRVAEELLRADSSAVRISDKFGNEPLWTAAFNANGDYELVSLLLRHGADPQHRNNVGLSPLDIAKRKNDDALLRILESNEPQK